MAKTTGAETPAASSATGTPEPTPAPPVEPAQDNFAKEIEEYKTKFAEAQGLVDQLKKEKNDAIANALRYDAMYKGLQNQTTKTLQKAAEDRKALTEAQRQAAEVADIKNILSIIAEKVLDEDEAKSLNYRQKELELQRREQAVQAFLAGQQVEEPVAQPQQYTTPEDERAQFISFYFPGVDVDPNDPNIDWGVGADSTQEAFRRLTTSVLKIKDQKDQTKANDAVATLKKQAEEQLEALKKQQEELQAKSAEELVAVKTAAEETARKETEKRLRALGADVSGASPSDGGPKTFRQNIEEQLDEKLLQQGKEGQKEYSRRVEAINKQFRERFQR